LAPTPRHETAERLGNYPKSLKLQQDPVALRSKVAPKNGKLGILIPGNDAVAVTLPTPVAGWTRDFFQSPTKLDSGRYSADRINDDRLQKEGWAKLFGN
jgi:hypothetical protein